jgi:tetratricopeptide (TPR) repeat protein
VRSSAWTAALVVLLAAGSVAAAPAATQLDDAKRAFSEGKAAFERGDYETALSSYQRANLILPAPNLYYNIGATYERLGRYQEAALAFDKYFELAGVAQSDEDRAFQTELRARADRDRKQMDTPQQRAVQPPPVYLQQRQPQWPPPQYLPPPGPSREVRLELAQARRTRAIALIAVGGALSLTGVILTSYYGGVDGIDGWTRGFALWGGITAFVVGVTLWAPGASSFVHASHDIKELSRPEPLPPTARGF